MGGLVDYEREAESGDGLKGARHDRKVNQSAAGES